MLLGYLHALQIPIEELCDPLEQKKSNGFRHGERVAKAHKSLLQFSALDRTERDLCIEFASFALLSDAHIVLPIECLRYISVMYQTRFPASVSIRCKEVAVSIFQQELVTRFARHRELLNEHAQKWHETNLIDNNCTKDDFIGLAILLTFITIYIIKLDLSLKQIYTPSLFADQSHWRRFLKHMNSSVEEVAVTILDQERLQSSHGDTKFIVRKVIDLYLEKVTTPDLVTELGRLYCSETSQTLDADGGDVAVTSATEAPFFLSE